MCDPRADLEYHYAGAGSGRVAKHLAKVAIQREERSAFGRAYLEQCLVRRPSQPLADNCNGIVAGARMRSAARRLMFSSSLNFTTGFRRGRG